MHHESWSERRCHDPRLGCPPRSRGAPVQAGQPLPIQPRCAARLHFQLPPEPKGKLVSGGRQWRTQQLPSSGGDLQPDDQLRPQGAPHTRLITMLQPPTRFPALKREQSCTVQTQTPDLSPSVPCLTLIQHCNILRA